MHLHQFQYLCIISNPSVNSNWSYSPETFNSGQNWRFSIPRDHEIWWMTLENNRAPLLYLIKLCASFKTLGEFKLKLQSGNAQFGSKSVIFVPSDLEIWWMTLKNNRAPLLRCFSCVHHFIAIGEFKLELQPGNAQFGSKSMLFCPVEI